MKLPHASEALVERAKVLGYLMNPRHPYGGGKAGFFRAFGFSSDKWEVLASALREHARTHAVRQVTETGFGPKYQIDGILRTPSGRTPMLRSIWQLDTGQLAPRLITAYPLEP